VALSCLLVDDSEEFLASASRLFSLQGVRVVGLASSGDEALRLAEDLSPDVARVDVELGEEDGIELARRLSSACSPPHVILISFRERGELAELMEACGAIGFLRKDVLDTQAVMDLIVPRRQRNAGPSRVR
jgi:two-component system, NarL family, nitrate/nitrite response regulator NarL